jgi:hypothetical protein
MNSVSPPNRARQALSDYLGTSVTRLTKELYGNRDRAFCHFALQLIYGLDEDDAASACGLGGADHGGIDAFWQDEDGNRVVIARAKCRDRGNTRVDRRSVDELTSAWTWLNEPSKAPSAALRLQIAEPAAALAQARNENPSVQIELLCVVSGALTPAAKKRADVFNSEHSSESVVLRLVGLDELVEANLERRSLEEGPISKPIKLKLREYFQESQQPGGALTLVASIDGQQLATIEQEYRYRIFQTNVRYQLPGKINENIDRTLKEPEGRRNFWYYNNGISIVCNHYDLDAKTKTVSIHNLQIVNGCQTTTTLGSNTENLSDPASVAVVLVRIIASDSEELQRKITIYNNRQNAVKDRDLLSNDSHQERLQEAFEALDPPWFYERKRGSWKAEIGTSPKRKKVFGSRVINNEKAAQTAYAFHYDPGDARARKRLLFVVRSDDPNGFYDLLFNDETTPEWLLVPFLVNKFVAARKNEYVRELRTFEERSVKAKSVAQKRLVKRSWIKFADQALIGTIAFYWRRRLKVLSQDNLQALLKPGILENELLPPSYALALNDLTIFFDRRASEAQEREEIFVATNYLKGNWKDIREHLLNEEEFRQSVDRDPLGDLPVVGSG